MDGEKQQNYICLSEAAKSCHYTQEYLSLRARQGKLKAVKLGRNWVTTKDWLKDYIAKAEEYNGSNGKIVKSAVEPEEKTKPPENLPVGELPAFRHNFKEQLYELRFGFRPGLEAVRPALAFVLTAVLVIAGGVFGKESLRQVYNDAAPVVEKLHSDLEEGMADAEKNIGGELLVAENLIYNYAEFFNNAGTKTAARIGGQTIPVDGQAITVRAAAASVSGIWQGYTEWAFGEGAAVWKNIRESSAGKEYAKFNGLVGKGFRRDIKTVVRVYSAANESAEKELSKIFDSYSKAENVAGKTIMDAAKRAKNGYVSANDFIEERIESDFQAMADLFERTYNFVTTPWKERLITFISSEPAGVPPEEIDELKSEIEQLKREPVIVKRVEVEKVIEPVKEITREIETEKRITKIDDNALAQLKDDIAYLEGEIGKRLYAPGGVISQTIRVTEPVQSPKIYQENGEIVLQTLGSGNVILSAATGLQLYGQQVVIESTNTLNPLIYLASKTRIDGDTAITGKLNVGDGLGVGGDLNVGGGLTAGGDLTVTGNQTINGVSAISASSTSPILSVTQTGSGDILNLMDGATEVFTVLDGGYVGIGTTTPATVLDVYGNVLVDGSNRYLNFNSAVGTDGYGFRDDGGNIQFKNSIGNWTDIGASGSGSNWQLFGTNALRPTTTVGIIVSASSTFTGTTTIANILTANLEPNNRVGIATTSPRYTLDVWGDFAVGTSTATSSTAIVPAFYVTSKDRPQIGIGTTTVGSNLLTVGTTTPSLVVDSSGNVGVASSTPGYLFGVQGQAYFSATSTFNSDLVVKGATKNTAAKIVAASDTPNRNARADYVATGTDDQAVIETAINSLPSGGGMVVLLEGTYYFSSTLNITRDVYLKGAGAGWNDSPNDTPFTRLYLKNGVNADVINIDKTVGGLPVQLEDIYIDGNKAGQTATSNGINIPVSNNIYHMLVFNRVTVSDANGDGLKINPAARALNDAWLTQFIAEDNAGAGIRLDGTTQNISVIFIRDTYLGTNRWGLYAEGSVSQTQVIGGTIRSNDEEGVYLKDINTSSNGISVIGVSVYYNNLDSAEHPDIYAENSRNLSFSSLNMLNSNIQPTRAIELASSSNNRISNINTYNYKRGAIKLSSSTYTNISDSVFVDSSRDANNTYDVIVLNGTSTHISINNITINETAANRARYGISEDSSTDDYNVIIGNIITGAVTAGLNIQGPHTTVAGNKTGSPNEGLFDIRTATAATTTALTVSQSGTGAIVLATSTSAMTSTAFQITNLGSGNSFVVEDSDADSTPFVIDASGNVAVSTSTARYALDVWGDLAIGTSTDYSTPALYVDSGNGGRIGIGTTTLAGLLTVGTTTPALVVTPNGKIGMGTANPTNSLELYGSNQTIVVNSTDNSYIELWRAANTNEGFIDFKTGDSYNFAVGMDNDGTSNFYIGDVPLVNKYLTIEPSGNIGIATTTPRFGYKLDVFGDLAVGTSTAGYGSASTTPALYVDSGNGGRIGIGTTTLAGLLTVGTTTPSFVVDSAGNVGIATTVPSYLFSVHGQSFFLTTSTVGADLVVQGALKNTAAKIVAASDTPNRNARADYVADGTNDEVEIQAAIDDLPSGGGRVILLEGTYNLSSTNVTIPSNTIIEGQGWNTIISGNGSDPVLFVNSDTSGGNNNIVVKNLMFDGNQTGAVGGGGLLHFAKVSDSLIENVYAKDGTSYGIGIARSQNIILKNSIAENAADDGVEIGDVAELLGGAEGVSETSDIYIVNTISRNSINSTSVGFEIEPGPKRVYFINTLTTGNRGGYSVKTDAPPEVAPENIYFFGAQSVADGAGSFGTSGFIIAGRSDNYVGHVGYHDIVFIQGGSGKNGMQIQYATSVDIQGGRIELSSTTSGYSGIYVGSGNTVVRLNIDGTNIINGENGWGGTYGLIYLDLDATTSDIVIRNTRLENSYEAGIYIDAATGITVSDLTIANNTIRNSNEKSGAADRFSGIALDAANGTFDSVVITGNRIYDDRSAHQQKYAILALGSGTHQNYFIANNVISGTYLDPPINVSGTNIVKIGNRTNNSDGQIVETNTTTTALTVSQSGTGAIVLATSTSAMTSAAFQITNLGSGNSFVVEDSDTDSTPFVIDASGNVAVSTSTARYALDVWGDLAIGTSTDYSTPALYVDSGNGGRIGIGTTTLAGLLTVGTTTQALFVDGAGKLGINGVAYSWPSSQGGSNTYLQNNGDGNLVWTTAAGGSNWQFEGLNAIRPTSTAVGILVSASSTFTGTTTIANILTANLEPNNRIGIATSSPRYTLDVWGDLAIGTSSGTGVPQDYPMLYVNSGEGGSSNGVGIGTTTLAGLLTVGTSTPRLVVDPAGNVGIGTDSPASALDIAGKLTVRGEWGGRDWATSYDGSLYAFYALAVYNGNLYAAQSGASGDGDILVFNGSDWSTSYNGTEEQIDSLAVYNGKLYAGQGNGAGDGDVLVFDGTTWSTSYNGTENDIYSLAVYNGKLYAGQGSGSGDGDVLVFDGTNWSTSYNGSSFVIYSLAVYNGKLYAGQAGVAGDGDVFVFDGNAWSKSYDGSTGYIMSLAVYDGKLYAGQGISASDGNVIVFDGNTWSASYDGAEEAIYELVVYDGKLYAGQGSGSGDGNVLVFDGNTWLTSYNGSEEYIASMAVYNGKLYAGQGNGLGDGDILVFEENIGSQLTNLQNLTNYFSWSQSASSTQEGLDRGRLNLAAGMSIMDNLGIATTTPKYKLDVQGEFAVGTTTNNSIFYINTGTSWYAAVGTTTANTSRLFSIGTTTDYLTVGRQGSIGIASSTPSETFAVQGNILGIGNIVISGTLNTGQGATEVYLMNQDVQTTDAVTFDTIDTGQGANELYAMDQPVRTTDSVAFVDLTITYGISAATTTITATSTLASIDADSGLLYIDAYADKIGIGTTTPRYKLDVWGDLAVGTSTGVGVPMDYPLLYVNSGEGGSSNGVGIGTTTLAGLLTVGTTTPALIVNSSGNTVISGDFYFNNASNNFIDLDSGNSTAFNFSDKYYQITLTTRAGVYGSNHGVIESSIGNTAIDDDVAITGNLGIGTKGYNSPNKLTVVGGGAYISGGSATTTGGILAVSFDGSATTTISSATSTFAGPIVGGGAQFIIATTTGNVLLQPYGGNVGIGTTTPYAALTISESRDFAFGSFNEKVLDDMEGDLYWTRSASISTSTESTIVKVGGQSLKFTASSTEDATIKKTFDSDQDLSSYEKISFWIYADRFATSTATTTQLLSFFYHDTGGTETTSTIRFQKEDRWQYQEISLTSTAADKDAVDYIGFRTDFGGIEDINFYIDQIRAYNETERAAEMFVGKDGALVILGRGGVEIYAPSAGSGQAPGLKVDSAVVELGQPLSVNVGGNVGMDYDLEFLNTGLAQITSEGPLRIAAGDSNHAENLTLTVGGTGDIIVELAASGTAMMVTQSYSATNSPAFIINSEANATTSPTSSDAVFKIITDVNSDENVVFDIDYGGNYTYDGTASSPASDVAENYRVQDNNIGSGDVVCLSPSGDLTVEKCFQSYQPNLFGVISGRPALLMAGGLKNSRMVALAGRVPVKISMENGPIAIGDPLTSASSTPGFAMKATRAGKIIGYALEKYNPSTYEVDATATDSDVEPASPDTILAFIHLDRLGGDLTVSQNEQGHLVVSNYTVFGQTQLFTVDETGALVVGKLKTQELCVGSVCVTEADFVRVFGAGLISESSTFEILNQEVEPQDVLPPTQYINGANRPCGTEVGVCQIGVQIYQDGVWGECIGSVEPSEEICDGVDNNCNGEIDESATCNEPIASPGEAMPDDSAITDNAANDNDSLPVASSTETQASTTEFAAVSEEPIVEYSAAISTSTATTTP